MRVVTPAIAALIVTPLLWGGESRAESAPKLTPQQAEALRPFLRADGSINAEQLNAALSEASAARQAEIENEDQVKPLLRESFDDLFLFGKPTDAADAKGAPLAYARDYAVGDEAWSAKGVVIIPYQIPGSFYSGFLGGVIAAYGGVDLEQHSKPDVKDREIYRAGGTFEVGLNGGLNSQWSHYVRGRLGAVHDGVADETTLRTTFEYRPSNADLGINGRWVEVPGTQLRVLISPSLRLQYDRATGGKPSPFSLGEDAVRLGPAITLKAGLPLASSAFLKSLKGQLSYRYDTEIVSGKNFSYLDLALFYNLDPDGHFAVRAGYTRGDNDDTAERERKFTLALTAKY